MNTAWTVTLATFATLFAHAETWHRLTARMGDNFTLNVPTNTLATVREVRRLAGSTEASILQVRYPGLELYAPVVHTGDRFLGPARLESTISNLQPEWGEDVLLVLVTLETVNGSASGAGNAAVLPSGVAAAVKLETSTDLVTWSETAPGPVPAGGTNRFYRATVTFAP